MNAVQLSWWMPTLLKGLSITVLASLAGILLSIVFGCILASLRALEIGWLSWLIRIYTVIFRNVPLLVVMYFIFYGFPALDINIPPIACGLIAITLNEGAFVAEILRGAIKNIRKGEIEAADCLGLNRLQVVRHIVFPLAFRSSVPALVGQSSIMIKDTSLFSMIMIIDLTGAASRYYATYFDPTSIWVVGVIYIGLFLIYSVIGRILERRIQVRR